MKLIGPFACLQVGKEGRLIWKRAAGGDEGDDIMSRHFMVKNAPGTLVLPWQIFHSGLIRKGSTEALCGGLIR